MTGAQMLKLNTAEVFVHNVGGRWNTELGGRDEGLSFTSLVLNHTTFRDPQAYKKCIPLFL